jgi:hypothetical protein
LLNLRFLRLTILLLIILQPEPHKNIGSKGVKEKLGRMTRNGSEQNRKGPENKEEEREDW